MKIPKPRFRIGARVGLRSRSPQQPKMGQVVYRKFDNLLHASEWSYQILWDDGTLTNGHYCYDLYPVRR